MARSKKNITDALVAAKTLARGVNTPGFQKFCFANHTPSPKGCTPVDESFLEWLVGAELAWSEDSELSTEDSETLYEGDRSLFERWFRRDEKRLLASFTAFPADVAWVAIEVDGALVPALQEAKSGCVLVLLVSATESASEGLVQPNPDRARATVASPTKRVWIEECGDGGVWIFGYDDDVLVFYVDGPGDRIYSRWRCTRATWNALWTATFGADLVEPTSGAASKAKPATKKPAAKKR